MTNEIMENTINPTMLLEFNKILEKERIHTYYQPIVSLKDGDILGYEALSRDLKTLCFIPPWFCFP